MVALVLIAVVPIIVIGLTISLLFGLVVGHIIKKNIKVRK